MKKIGNFGKRYSVTKRLRICITVFLIIHLLIVFFFYFQQKLEELMKERSIAVEYKEEEKKKEEKKKEEKPPEEKKKEEPKLAPQVATITMQQFLQIKQMDKIDENLAKKLEKIARPMDEQITNQKIDIDKMIDMHSNQANLDLNAYSQDIDLGNVAVVSIGKGLTNDQILSQDKVQMGKEALALNVKVGLVAMPGFAGDKSGGGLEQGGIDLGKSESPDIASQKKAMTDAMKEKNEKKIDDSGSKKPSTEIEISSALKERLLSMPPPPYPDEAQQQGLGGTIMISIKIDENGQMTGMPIVMQTTGYQWWDNAVISYIKSNWKWSKKPGVVSAGTITIRFTIG
jgi:TonB family protein